MPYTITSKVLDADGYPIAPTAVVVSELADANGMGAADVTADADGSFTFIPLSQYSLITIEAVGYEPKIFQANTIPAEIRLDFAEGLNIEGKTTPKAKPDYTLYYVGAGVLVGLGIYLAYRANNNKAAAPAKSTGLAAPKPKHVTLRF